MSAMPLMLVSLVCARYHHGGSPLPISASPLAPRPCPACGAARVFELQLVPSLVSFLCQNKEQGGASSHVQLFTAEFMLLCLFDT